MLKFVVKDYDLLKKHFYEHIWGLLLSHNFVKKEDIPADRSQVDEKWINKLSDHRRPDIIFLLKTVERLDADLESKASDERELRVAKLASARKLTGALTIIDNKIVASYSVKSRATGSYWHTNTPLITGEASPHPDDATVKNLLDNESKIALVNQACAFLTNEIYDTVKGQKKLRADHKFMIAGFDCIQYLKLGVNLAASAQNAFLPESAAELAAAQKAAAQAEKKRQAEADKAAGKKTSFFGSFFSTPVTAPATMEDPVIAALSQDLAELEGAGSSQSSPC